MDKYSWVITEDHISSGGKPGTNLNAVGVIGPWNAHLSQDEIIAKGERFEIYDDDEVLYYVGYLVGGSGFEPLDDFGAPNAGACNIKYDGRWL